MEIGDNFPAFRYGYAPDANQLILYYLTQKTPYVLSASSEGFAVKDTGWHHVVIMNNPGSGVEAYDNGVKITDFSLNGEPASSAQLSRIAIGGAVVAADTTTMKKKMAVHFHLRTICQWC